LNFEERAASHILEIMKRAIAVLLLISMLGPVAFAQADAVALAAQREAEENVRRLTATVEEVQTAQANLRKLLSDLAADVDKLREDVAKSKNNAATQESLKRLGDQIMKVDESRVADNKRIQEGLDKITKLVAQAPVAPIPAPARTEVAPRANTTTTPGNGSGATSRPRTEQLYEYVVRPGDRLDIIASTYRNEGIPVTAKAIREANPEVVWEKLRIGQKIYIPKPK
jgi:hypothetical protein